jgi:hypothetical protein
MSRLPDRRGSAAPASNTIAGGASIEITSEAIQRYLVKHVTPADHERIRRKVEAAISAATTAPASTAGSDEQREELAMQIVSWLVLSMSSKEMVAVTNRAHQIAKNIEKSARIVETEVTAEPLRHRQTKEAETDMCSLPPPRHISTPPDSAVPVNLAHGSFTPKSRPTAWHRGLPKRAKSRLMQCSKTHETGYEPSTERRRRWHLRPNTADVSCCETKIL